MRKLIGVVVSDKMSKAAVVRVDRHVSHALYKKRFVRSSRFHVRDAGDELKVGDVVEIEETRPLSKLIHFRVSRIIGRSEETVKELEEETALRLEREAREAEREQAKNEREKKAALDDKASQDTQASPANESVAATAKTPVESEE